MPDTELFRFWVPPDGWHKRRHLTSYRMTVEEARARFGDAVEPDLTSREVRAQGEMMTPCPPMPRDDEDVAERLRGGGGDG